jgi:hypothetical protein
MYKMVWKLRRVCMFVCAFAFIKTLIRRHRLNKQGPRCIRAGNIVSPNISVTVDRALLTMSWPGLLRTTNVALSLFVVAPAYWVHALLDFSLLLRASRGNIVFRFRA